MAWTKAEKEEFHQLDLAVTRLEARIQILTEHVNKLQMHTFAPRPYVQDEPRLPSFNVLGNALGSIL